MQKIANWLNPWSALATAQRRIDAMEQNLRALDDALNSACDRYERLREANAQLRETLTLYRNDPPRQRIDEQTLARYRLADWSE